MTISGYTYQAQPILLESYKQHFQGVKERELRVQVHARITGICWSCDGKRLAVASSDGFIRIWTNINSGSPIELSVSGDEKVAKYCHIAAHPNKPNILACCSDSNILIYNMEDGCRLLFKQEFRQSVINICWNREGTLLLLGTKSDTIFCFSYHISSHHLEQIWKYQCPFEANQIGFDKDGRILIASSPGSVNVLCDHQIMDCVRCANGTAYSLAISSSVDLFAVGSADATITIFETSLEPVAVISRPEWPVRCLSFSYDGIFLAAVGSDDRFIDVSVMPLGDGVHRLPVAGPVGALAWHPASYLLCYACDQVDKNGRAEFVVRVFGFSQ
jgi:THO complex subunit 3